MESSGPAETPILLLDAVMLELLFFEVETIWFKVTWSWFRSPRGSQNSKYIRNILNGNGETIFEWNELVSIPKFTHSFEINWDDSALNLLFAPD